MSTWLLLIHVSFMKVFLLVASSGCVLVTKSQIAGELKLESGPLFAPQQLSVVRQTNGLCTMLSYKMEFEKNCQCPITPWKLEFERKSPITF